MVQMERTSSIENEPRTLSIDQIQVAREAALFVVNTRSREEALRIFTEGLKPIVVCEMDDQMDAMVDNDENLDNLSYEGMRNIVTAPF